MPSVTDTAATIALIRAEEEKLPARERLFDDPFAHLFVLSDTAREVTERFLSVPFFRENVRLRTRFIDDSLRDALRDGTRQTVILGAGFDCRALRLDEIAATGATVYEVDFGPQLEEKREVLERAGVVLPRHLCAVPCDFTSGDWGDVLRADLEQEGFRPNEPTLFICEGVVGYLDDDQLESTLQWMARTGASGSQAVFNYTQARLDTETARRHAERAGFSAFREYAFDSVWERYLPGEPPGGATLFRIALATR